MDGGGGGWHIVGVDTCSLLQGSIGNVLFSQQMKSDDVYHRGFPLGHVLLQDVMALYSKAVDKGELGGGGGARAPPPPNFL